MYMYGYCQLNTFSAENIGVYKCVNMCVHVCVCVRVHDPAYI